MVEKTDVFEALKVLANIVPHKLKTEDEWFPAYVTMIKYLRNSEPVRHGKWIRTEDIYLVGENDDGAMYEYRTTWTCSECGYKRRMASKPDDKFCKECGADMRESD